MIEEEFNFAAACDQVYKYQVAVKLKRLQEHEIESLTPNWRRRRRNVKRKHDKLDFDKVDDDVYFSMVCEESSSLYREKSVRRYRRKNKNSQVISERKSSVDESSNPPPSKTQSTDSLTSSLSVSTDGAVSLKCLSVDKNECASKVFLVKKNCSNGANPTRSVPSYSRLRVKTAIELGISFAFLIDNQKTEPPRHNLMESAFPSSTSNNDSVVDSGMSDKLDLKIIAKLYQKYCTPEIREKLVFVAKTLKHIEKCTDETNASIDKINKSQSSDAEKLMMRFQTYGELNRKKNSCYSTLKDQFKFLDKVDNENFELLFQILFLSTLKILTLQMPTPHKKGTLFKKILKLLSNCFESQAGKNDRIFNLLKKNSFRGDCLTLFQFLEKNKEDKFFEFLRVHDKEEEKTIYPNRGLNTSSGHFIHKDEVRMRRILPCGRHLMVQNTSLLKLNYKADIPVYQFAKKLVPLTNSQTSSKPNLTTASFASNPQPTTSVLSSTANRISNAGFQVNDNQQVLKYTVKLNGPTVTFHPSDDNSYLTSLKNQSCLVNTREQTCPNVYRNPASHPGNNNFIPFPSGSTTGNNYSFSGVQNYDPHNVTRRIIKNNSATEASSTRLNETRHPAIESPNPLIGHTASEITSYQDFQTRSASATHTNGSSNNGPVTPLTTNNSNHIQQSRPSTMSITSKGKNNENRMPMQVPSDERPPTLKNLLNDGPLLNHADFPGLSTHQNGILNTSTATVPKTNLHSTSKHTCSYKFCEKDATVLCGGCSKTFYCGNHCQKMDWVCGHDRICAPHS